MKIHHVTAIASDPQANVDFYVGLLGLRLVKRTVNFDDPGTWHVYYGDGIGTPGTLMTFFAWANLPPLVRAQAKRGAGQIDAVAFRIPAASLPWWRDYLAGLAVHYSDDERFGESLLVLADPDGVRIELVAAGGAGAPRPWLNGPVPLEHAITGMRGVSIPVHSAALPATMLQDALGFRRVGVEGERHRYEDDGAVVDLLVEPDTPAGRMGVGATHHIAWRAATDEEQAALQQQIATSWSSVTPVQERLYFRSIYFRDPSGVVHEIATDGPGFTVDEDERDLGSALRLPPWLEPRRDRIAARLPEFTVRVSVR